jgi:hypothetical protein
LGLHFKTEFTIVQARQRQGLRVGQGNARCSEIGLNRQLSAAAVYQHGQPDVGWAAVIKQLIDDRTNGATGVQHIVQYQYVGALNFKGQGGLPACRQTALCKVVAVHG